MATARHLGNGIGVYAKLALLVAAVASTLVVEVPPVAGSPAIKATLAAGGAHTCAVLYDGGVDCWGSNDNGQLGNNSTTDSSAPVAVAGVGGNGTLTGVTSLAAGYQHTCALLTGGGVVCWGRGDLGQLGNNSTTNSSVPVAVVGLGGVGTLTAAGLAIGGGGGGHHTCALLIGGGMACWGDNNFGQLGNNSTTNSSVPVMVVGAPGGSAAEGAVGGYHTCAVVGTGVMCWGLNSSGQLGNNTTTSSSVPVMVVVSGKGNGLPLIGVATLAAGYGHTCARLSSGGVDCWGDNLQGQLGNNTNANSSTPVVVHGVGGSGALTGVTAVTAGVLHTCALLSGGGVDCWGYNSSGQLGNNSTTNSSTPVGVASEGDPTSIGSAGATTGGTLRGVTAVGAGFYHTCAFSAGSVDCWGYNSYGQLGNSSKTNSSKPARVQNFYA